VRNESNEFSKVAASEIDAVVKQNPQKVISLVALLIKAHLVVRSSWRAEWRLDDPVQSCAYSVSLWV